MVHLAKGRPKDYVRQCCPFHKVEHWACICSLFSSDTPTTSQSKLFVRCSVQLILSILLHAQSSNQWRILHITNATIGCLGFHWILCIFIYNLQDQITFQVKNYFNSTHFQLSHRNWADMLKNRLAKEVRKNPIKLFDLMNHRKASITIRVILFDHNRKL